MSDSTTSGRLKAPTKRGRSGQLSLYLMVSGVAVVLVVLGALMATGHFLPKPANSNTTPGKVLETAGNSYEVPIGQYAAVDFFLSSPSTIHGSFTTTNGVTSYAFNTSGYTKFQKSGGLDASEAAWSMGNVSHGSYNFQLPRGSWVLVWATTSQIWGTQVNLVTDLTADPG